MLIFHDKENIIFYLCLFWICIGQCVFMQMYDVFNNFTIEGFTHNRQHGRFSDIRIDHWASGIFSNFGLNYGKLILKEQRTRK